MGIGRFERKSPGSRARTTRVHERSTIANSVITTGTGVSIASRDARKPARDRSRHCRSRRRPARKPPRSRPAPDVQREQHRLTRLLAERNALDRHQHLVLEPRPQVGSQTRAAFHAETPRRRSRTHTDRRWLERRGRRRARETAAAATLPSALSRRAVRRSLARRGARRSTCEARRFAAAQASNARSHSGASTASDSSSRSAIQRRALAASITSRSSIARSSPCEYAKPPTGRAGLARCSAASRARSRAARSSMASARFTARLRCACGGRRSTVARRWREGSSARRRAHARLRGRRRPPDRTAHDVLDARARFATIRSSTGSRSINMPVSSCTGTCRLAR